MSTLAYLLNTGVITPWRIHSNETVNITFTLQMMMLPLSLVMIVLTRAINRENFRTFFRLGISFRPGQGDDQNWNTLGPMFALAFTGGTIMLMSIGVMSQSGTMNSEFIALLPLVFLFAATNAWTEEIFTRLTIVAGLHGKINPIAICWTSAIVFGIPHFFGTPSGVFGVIASGALGWVLAKSVIESKGLGCAWLIHFLQDVVIFGAGAMVVAGNI